MNFQIPSDLSEKGRQAAEIISSFCNEHRLKSSQRVFIDPEEWSGSCYGQNSLLIVMHEGSDANRALSMDGAYEQNGGDYSLYESLVERLREAGVFIEQCTRYHSAIYEV
jgi:hypothetical protein